MGTTPKNKAIDAEYLLKQFKALNTKVFEKTYSKNKNAIFTGSFSHNRKSGTTIGMSSFAEGDNTEASGDFSHAEGDFTTASGYDSHAEGSGTTASEFASHAEGGLTTASGSASHAEGSETTASGSASHAEGDNTEASGNFSHAEGKNTIANGESQHVQGKYNIADTTSAFIIGNGSSNNARSNAMKVDWSGNLEVAGYLKDGSGNTLKNMMSKTNPTGTGSFSLNRKAGTTIGTNSFAEGYQTTASGDYSHAEGSGTTASASYTHSEGVNTSAIGQGSHAEGINSIASGHYSHVEGNGTITNNETEHASGKYNQSNSDTIFSVGDGASDSARHNAFEITKTGGKLHDKDIATIDLIPTILPANGGNADTVNNHTVDSDVPVDAVFTDTVYDDTDIRAELADIRVGADGNTYQTAGEAVRTQVGELKQDKVDKDEILNAGIKSFSYVPLFGGEFTVTTVNEEGYISPHSRASVTGRISKHYTYRITINSEVYELPCDLYTINENGAGKVFEYLGNLSLYTENTSGLTHDIRDVPFCIISSLDTNSSIDVFTQSSGTVSITVEQIHKEQTVLPKSLIWGDDYCPIELKKNEGSTFNGISIGVNHLRNARGTTAIGNGNELFSDFGIVIGNTNKITETHSICIGHLNTSSGKASQSQGWGNTASGNWSYASGYETTASGLVSRTEGFRTTASGDYSHAEGYQTNANGKQSYTEGYKTNANGGSSHAEGQGTTANGAISHSGGNQSITDGRSSFAHGNFAKATQPAQFAVGYGNDPQEDSIFEVGNGLNADGGPNNTGNTEPVIRQNAFRVTQSGVAVAQTGLQIGNTIINEEQLQKIIALIN